MSPNISNLSHGGQVVDARPDSGQHSREVTQEDRTIDHAPRLNRFTLGIFSGTAPARLVAASIPSESARIARHGDSQAPAFDAGTLIAQGFDVSPLETLHNPTPEPAPIADLGRAIKAGGEGVEASARSQSSQYISPSRKFSHCHSP
jgi:hypothetical protein